MLNLEYSVSKVCCELPKGYSISLYMEKGYAGFEVTDDTGRLYPKITDDIDDDIELSLSEKLDAVLVAVKRLVAGRVG